MKNLFGNIQSLYDNKEVSEIIIDGFNDVYWEANGKVEESETLFQSEDEIKSVFS